MPEHRQPDSPENLPTTSSVPTVIPEDQETLFQQVLTLLEQCHIRYAVAGAFALQKHTGICRDTKDLDVFLTADEVVAALACLQKRGFETEVRDPIWLYKAHRDEFFVDLITGMSNATIVVEDSWIARAKPAVVHGIQTRVLAPEELLVSKLFVIRRERFDGADIAHVIYGTHGNLDWQRIFQLVGEHWEILFWALVLFRYSYPAQTQYVPAKIWDDLITRFHDAVSRPDPAAKFRGSLVDDKMFAIDVNEWGLHDLLLAYRERRMQKIPRDLLKSNSHSQ